jgi:hypothetical protein
LFYEEIKEVTNNSPGGHKPRATIYSLCSTTGRSMHKGHRNRARSLIMLLTGETATFR